MTDGLRLTEILTTGSAIANYLGVPMVQANHLRLAIDVLNGDKNMDDLGRPQSPMIARVTRAGSGVAPEVQEFAQRWFARLGGDAMGELAGDEMDAFAKELCALVLSARPER